MLLLRMRIHAEHMHAALPHRSIAQCILHWAILSHPRQSPATRQHPTSS